MRYDARDESQDKEMGMMQIVLRSPVQFQPFPVFLIPKTSHINSEEISKFPKILDEIELAKDQGVLCGMQSFQPEIFKIFKKFRNEERMKNN